MVSKEEGNPLSFLKGGLLLHVARNIFGVNKRWLDRVRIKEEEPFQRVLKCHIFCYNVNIVEVSGSHTKGLKDTFRWFPTHNFGSALVCVAMAVIAEAPHEG